MSTPNPTAARRVRVETGVYRRRDDKLEIGWRDASGRQKWRVIDGGIRAARAALAEEHAKRARGERVAVDPRLTFSDAASHWWDARVVKLRPATRSAYAAGLKHLRKPEHFGRSRLRDVTATDVARYVSRQQAAGLRGWTIAGHLTVLSAVFSYAARHLGHAGVNPVSLLDSVERPGTADMKPKRILTADELARLLAGVDADYRTLFALAAETGLRLAEVIGLAWEDVDLDAGTVAVTFQLDRSGKRVPLKTKRSRRALEVTPGMVSKLRAHKLASAHSGLRDYVFPSRTGSGLEHRNVGGRVLRRAVEAAGLEAQTEANGNVTLPAPTFHSLRHSHASQLIAAGWDVAEVSARLGHSSTAITLNTYVHEFDAASRSSDRRDRLAALYDTAAPVEASVEAEGVNGAQQTDPAGDAEPAQLRAVAGGRQ